MVECELMLNLTALHCSIYLIILFTVPSLTQDNYGQRQGKILRNYKLQNDIPVVFSSLLL